MEDILFNQIKTEDIQLFQNLINALGINQNVEFQFISLNFKILTENSQKTIQFENQQQKHIFASAGAQIQNQPNSIIYKNNQLFSIACILEYFYLILANNNNIIQSKSDFINLCNQFMIALGQSRVYTNTSVKWHIWNTYWSTPNQQSKCYSNCSGVCNQETCVGGQCVYYFPANEINNPNLPEKERKDANNRFDDKLYYLASLFDRFVKEEANKLENFFFSHNQKILHGQLQTKNFIKVEMLQGNAIELKSLSELQKVDKNQIKSLSILSLEKNSIPKGELQRKQLYDFILSLQNLNSLEIQLEAGIYHTNEENFKPPKAMKYFIPVPNDVVNNFVKFLSQLKIEKLSLILDEFCYLASIGLDPIFNCLPKINQKLKILQLSVNFRRMYKAKHILETLCQIKQLEVLYLKIKNQWATYHCTYDHIKEDFHQWETQLKQSLQKLACLKID